MACHFSGCYCKELKPSRSKFSQGKCGSCGHLESEHGQIHADVSYGDDQIVNAPQHQQQQYSQMNNQQQQPQYGDYNPYQMQQQQNYDPYQQQQQHQQQMQQNQYDPQMNNMNQNQYGSQQQINFNQQQQQQQQQQYGSQMNMNMNNQMQPQNDPYGNGPPMNAVYGAAGPQVNFGQNQQQYGSQMNMNMNQQQMYQQPQQQPQGIVYQSKSKYWNDQQSQQEFTMYMTQRMQQILGNNRFDHNVNQLCAAINATCDETLKAAKKPNYKYISHTLIIPNDSPYNMGDSKHWSLKTDICMQVNVRSMYMTAILEAYCSAM